MTAKKAAAPRTAPAAPAVPEGAFDLDAARAARAEAAGDPFVFVFGGEVWTLPPSREWPLEATDALAAGHIGPAMRVLLGDQWAEFAKQGARVGDLTDLFQGLSAWQGLTPGE